MKTSTISGLLTAALVAAAPVAAAPKDAPSGKTASGGTAPGLVGAWVVSASRPGGEGILLLTFSSDGTFFRSGDTHPTLSVAHGAWKRAGAREYDGTYVALRFDDAKKYVGTQRTRLHLTQGPGENEFTGLAKVSVLDASGKEEKTSETKLAGKRIQVEPF
jgi:hypothetical protein